MIKKSLYENEITLLKKRYGADNILTAKNSWSVIIKNFVPPSFYKVKEAMLYIEVSDGYGFGIAPMVSYISLPAGFSKMHLFRVGNEIIPGMGVQVAFSKDFYRFPEKIRKIPDKHAWFWMCFHFYANFKMIDNGTLADPAAETDFIGMVEYVAAIYFVLQKIAEGDAAMMLSMTNMLENYENARDEREKLVDMFKLELNWKRIKWMY